MHTIHRDDFKAADFMGLAQLFSALWSLEDKDGFSIFRRQGEISLMLPVWYKAGSSWRLSRYKLFNREAIWIDTKNFRRTCNYLRMKEPMLIDLLYRFSILAVVPSQQLSDRPRFRQPNRLSQTVSSQLTVNVELGFMLECRRALGDFRKHEVSLDEH
jgi:hypothetical protein